MNPQSSITIFTDGASRGNPGPGGFGAIIILPRQNDEKYDVRFMIYELGGREEKTTNNRMELRAAIEALSFIHKSKIINHKSILTYSDSAYLINGITRWIRGWQKNGWKTKNKKDVENRDLWEQLLRYSTIYRTIAWKLVGGHTGVRGNTRCDEIATVFADGKQPFLYKGPLNDYPIKDILDITHNNSLLQAKGEKRARSAAKAYSYVSMVNGAIQVHSTWGACEARVKGKKAKYQKVFSADEERKLIVAWSQ